MKIVIKAILFDLDGLLINSEPYWEKADRTLLKKYGHTLTADVREKLIGRGLRECAQLFIKHFNLTDSVETVIEKRHKELYKIFLKDLKLMPHAKDLIVRFKNEGYVLALATGGHLKEKVKEMLEKLEILDYFTEIISSYDIKRGKPYPDIYIECAKKLKVSPAECLVIEDAVNGVEAARGAGMKVIGVNKNKKMRSDLKKEGAYKVFPSLNLRVEDLR